MPGTNLELIADRFIKWYNSVEHWDGQDDDARTKDSFPTLYGSGFVPESTFKKLFDGKTSDERQQTLEDIAKAVSLKNPRLGKSEIIFGAIQHEMGYIERLSGVDEVLSQWFEHAQRMGLERTYGVKSNNHMPAWADVKKRFKKGYESAKLLGFEGLSEALVAERGGIHEEVSIYSGQLLEDKTLLNHIKRVYTIDSYGAFVDEVYRVLTSPFYGFDEMHRRIPLDLSKLLEWFGIENPGNLRVRNSPKYSGTTAHNIEAAERVILIDLPPPQQTMSYMRILLWEGFRAAIEGHALRKSDVKPENHVSETLSYVAALILKNNPELLGKVGVPHELYQSLPKAIVLGCEIPARKFAAYHMLGVENEIALGSKGVGEIGGSVMIRALDLTEMPPFDGHAPASLMIYKGGGFGQTYVGPYFIGKLIVEKIYLTQGRDWLQDGNKRHRVYNSLIQFTLDNAREPSLKKIEEYVNDKPLFGPNTS